MSDVRDGKSNVNLNTTASPDLAVRQSKLHGVLQASLNAWTHVEGHCIMVR